MKMVFCGVEESLLDKEISFTMNDSTRNFFLECQSEIYKKAGIEEGKYYDVIKYDTPNGLYDCYIVLEDNTIVDVNSCFFSEELEDEIKTTKAISLDDLISIQSSGSFLDVMNGFMEMMNGYTYTSFKEAYKVLTEGLYELCRETKEMRDNLIESLGVDSFDIPLDMMIELEEQKED